MSRLIYSAPWPSLNLTLIFFENFHAADFFNLTLLFMKLNKEPTINDRRWNQRTRNTYLFCTQRSLGHPSELIFVLRRCWQLNTRLRPKLYRIPSEKTDKEYCAVLTTGIDMFFKTNIRFERLLVFPCLVLQGDPVLQMFCNYIQKEYQRHRKLQVGIVTASSARYTTPVVFSL